MSSEKESGRTLGAGLMSAQYHMMMPVINLTLGGQHGVHHSVRQTRHPSKHDALDQCCFIVGPASQTLAQH